MNKLRLLVLGVLTLSAALQPLAAQTRQIGERAFERAAGSWTQIDPDGRQFAVDPRVITVRFKGDASRNQQDNLYATLGHTELRRAATGFIDIEVAAGQDVFDAIDAYQASGLVEIVEPTTIGRYNVEPNDPGYASQWFPAAVSAPAAWDITAGSPNAIVAILDSGTEYTHEDLGLGADAYQNIWLNAGEDPWSDPADPGTGNGVDDDLNGLVDDWLGWDFGSGNNDIAGPFYHGTSVAGVVGAKTNNAVGVASIAGGWNGPGAKLMIAGVGDSAPVGSILDDAILYSGAMGAHVVQLSLTVGQSAAIDAAIEMARNTYDMSVICASGNDGLTSVGYPSVHPLVVAVGATNQSDQRASFSNHGPDVEVSAPGTSMYTATTGNAYASTSGTSFAAPTVSGVVALMLSVNPGLDSETIRQILRDTADKVGGYDYNWDATRPGHSFELGYGRVNALAAVQAAMNVPAEIFKTGFESATE